MVVLCDSALSLIAMSRERRGLPHYAVDFTNPDIAKVAEAFGVDGKVCETTSEVEAAITSAWTRRRLTVIQSIVNSGPCRV